MLNRILNIIVTSLWDSAGDVDAFFYFCLCSWGLQCVFMWVCFCVIMQEELAFVFEMLQQFEDALVQYDELDALFTQYVLNFGAGGK